VRSSSRRAARHRAGDEADRARQDRRPLLVTARTAGVLLAISMLLSISGVLDEQASTVVDDLGQLLAGAAAAFFSWWSWRRSQPPDRRWRLLLALGTAGWTCGQAIWSYYQVFLGVDLPSPSLADVGYFALPLLGLPALWVFPARTAARAPGSAARPDRPAGRPFSRLVFVLDSLLVVGSLFLLTWATSLGAALHARGDAKLPQFLVALGYPVTDLMLVVFVVLLGRFRLPRNPGALALFGLGTICISVSDSFYLYLVSRGAPSMPPLYNIGFLVGPVLLALCTLVPPPPAGRLNSEHRRGTERRLVLLPYLPLTFTGVLVTGQLLTGGPIDTVETFVGLALVGLVVLRQFVTLIDNTRLLRQVRESEDLLRTQAFNDSLTGLANRALFRDRLERAVHERPGRVWAAPPPDIRRNRGPGDLGLVFCDLDDFKLVNDALGHAAGDELLRAVALRLRGCVRDGDTVARLGGDEFAVLLRAGPEPPETIGARILAAVTEPFLLKDPATGSRVTARVGASVGVAVVEPDEESITPDALMARGDAAMYAAKRRGKSRVVTFRGDVSAGSAGLAGELRVLLTAPRADAVARPAGSIDVMYQPVVRLRTAEVVALEALVRWRHPRHGLLPAQILLAAAEEAGLVGALEDLVLQTACRDVERMRRKAGLTELVVHVNLSAQRTTDARLVATVRDALARHRLPGRALVLELTETARVPDMGLAAQVLQQIRELDVALALDDFGAGFSGLSYLLQLPIDIVKLDASLATAVPDSRGAAIRNAAATLTLGLGLELIAEGIETPAQVEELAALGCELGQGFLYSPPRFAHDLAFVPRPTASSPAQPAAPAPVRGEPTMGRAAG
jgi:diguanylate cyclase (GGDEF)-like protein